MRKLTVEEYKQRVLAVLAKIDAICRENNLKYCLAYGTLLGAIRHDGFIPWDDDADIVMFRKDYIKLREIINKGSYGITFIDTTTDYNTIFPYGKVCDLSTHLEQKNFRTIKNYGAFVDVFPLDYLPEDEKERIKFCKKFRRQEIMITHSTRVGYEKTSSFVLNLKRFIAFHVGHLLNASKMIAKMDKAYIENDKKPTNYVGIPWAWNGYAFHVRYYKDLIEHEFEGHKFFVQKEYDYVLRWRYGDYMILPPENERITHSLTCYADD